MRRRKAKGGVPCDTCKHKYDFHGEVTVCGRHAAGLDCQYEEGNLGVLKAEEVMEGQIDMESYLKGAGSMG